MLVALLLWCAVGIGLLYASGRLAWMDRYPWAARILEGFAPRLTMALPATVLKRNPALAPYQGREVIVGIRPEHLTDPGVAGTAPEPGASLTVSPCRTTASTCVTVRLLPLSVIVINC